MTKEYLDENKKKRGNPEDMLISSLLIKGLNFKCQARLGQSGSSMFDLMFRLPSALLIPN
jgi:hypothetical protein